MKIRNKNGYDANCGLKKRKIKAKNTWLKCELCSTMCDSFDAYNGIMYYLYISVSISWILAMIIIIKHNIIRIIVMFTMFCRKCNIIFKFIVILKECTAFYIAQHKYHFYISTPTQMWMQLWIWKLWMHF